MTNTTAPAKANPFLTAWIFLDGKKTYLLALAGILNAIAQSTTWEQALTNSLPYLTGAAIRHGLALK